MQTLLAAATILAGASACEEMRPREIMSHVGQGYVLDEGIQLVFGRDASLDTEYDYGQRAMLYVSQRGESQRTYYSSGAGDSSAMKPSFFGQCGPHRLLILAEVGNEFSWGFRVFAYDGKSLRDLGEIPIAVQGDPDMESAIPFVQFTPHDKVVDLTFTTSVLKDPGSQFPQALPAGSVRYQIGSTSVRER